MLEAHRLLFHSTLGLRVRKKKEEDGAPSPPFAPHDSALNTCTCCGVWFKGVYLTESVYNVVLQQLISAQIRLLSVYPGHNKG